MKLFSFHLFYLICILAAYSAAKMQRYATRGKLLCGSVPVERTQVKLVDIDRPGTDDLMDESFTNEHGEFYLEGQTEEFTPIEPVLKVYHDCSDGYPCNRRWKVALPRNLITEPGVDITNRTFDIGVYNLEIHWKREGRHCIH